MGGSIEGDRISVVLREALGSLREIVKSSGYWYILAPSSFPNQTGRAFGGFEAFHQGPAFESERFICKGSTFHTSTHPDFALFPDRSLALQVLLRQQASGNQNQLTMASNTADPARKKCKISVLTECQGMP